MSKDLSLYGKPRVKSSNKQISSSTSLAFTSQLSSLLSTSDESRTSAGRSRPTGCKSDIFTSHNRNAKKRAAKDLEGEETFERPFTADIGGVDEAVLQRSKRKMEEKARLYAAMKRGDYIPPGGVDSRDERGLVDFDRKWAEHQASGKVDTYDTSSDEGNAGSDEELVDYEDQFGRQRRGTRADVEREERRRKAQAAMEPDRFSARPVQPTNLIFGDTVQTAAFNPDEPVAVQMEALAAKRDRSATPPEEAHYDANAEVRSKGVGFYSFSKDKVQRKKELEELERERLETEKQRKEREAKKSRKKADIEERRILIARQKGKKQADRFLHGLTHKTGEQTLKGN
ncbi:MAG: hypothetical protein M1836_007297 [Candelina mexicana]|nr:MAG: hypothetical protein M1836_007297 [Candelina mexicana]